MLDISLSTGTLSHSRFTIVSALITNVNQRSDRDIQKYVDLGYHLLDVHIKQIVFMERSVFDKHFYSRYNHLAMATHTNPRIDLQYNYKGKTYSYVVFGRITFVFFEKQDMYLWDVKHDITEFELDTPHPTKDTLEYMFVQCHKTEWVAIAISLDNLPGNYYVWMDFGIRHMFPSDIAFDMEIYLLRDRQYVRTHYEIRIISLYIFLRYSRSGRISGKFRFSYDTPVQVASPTNFDFPTILPFRSHLRQISKSNLDIPYV